MSSDTEIVVLSVGRFVASPLEAVTESADDISVRSAATVSEATSTLTETTAPDIDCVLLDAGRTESPVSSAIERVREKRPNVPVVVGGATGPVVREALDAGATEFVDWERDAVRALLTNRIRNAVERSHSTHDRPDSEQTASPTDSDYSRQLSLSTGPGGRRSTVTSESNHCETLGGHYDHTLEALLERSCDRLSILDRDGTYKFVSPAVEHLMGYKPAELEGTSGFEYVHPEDRERVEETFDRIVANPEEVHDVEYRLRDADGEWRWVESRGTNRLDDPEIEGIVVNSREITDRKERDRKLREERKRFEVLFDHLTQPIVEVTFEDGEPMVKRVNSAFEETFGYDADEVVGQSLDEYLVSDSRQEEADEINRQAIAGDGVDARHVTRQTADGEREFLFQTALYDDGTGGFGVYTDVSERVERQRRLEQYEAVAEAVDDLVYAVDDEGYLQFLNDAQESMTGYSREELLGEHISKLMPDESRQQARERIRELRESDAQSATFERTAITADGEKIYCEDHMSLLPSDDGTFQGTAGIVRDITDRKEREQQIEAERKRYRTLFERLPEPTVEFELQDGDPVVKRVNPAFERTFGYDASEVRGESVDDYVVPESQDEEAQRLNERVASGQQFTSQEVTRKTADGIRYFLLQTALYNEGTEGFAVYADITEQKAREEDLREERALTDTIFDAIPDVFYAFDNEINFLRWNDRLSEVTGYTDDEIASMHPAEFVAPEDQEQIFDGIAEVIENGQTVTVEARFETKDGERIPYEFTGAQMVDETGERLGLVGIGRDISERKERQRRFEAVFNNTYQFTGLMEPDGTILEANDTALAFGGVDREAVVGKRLWEAYWFQHNDRAREVAREAVEQARNGELYREELEVQGAEGVEVIDFSVRPILDEQGSVRLLIPEGRTITSLKRRERQLRVLNRFLRHNLRNKMTVIEGTAEYLMKDFADTEYATHLEQLRDTALELIGLGETAHELLKLTVEADTDPKPVDPEAVLSRAVTELRAEYPSASVSLSVETVRSVVADYRLKPVFEQLIENGIVHTDHDSPTVSITITERDGDVSIRVVDDGPGIPDAELSGIVTDEEQTQLTHGTGFGLWLVRSVVDDYSGDIDYETLPGGGSVVIVTLRSPDEFPADTTRSSPSGTS